MKDHLKPYKDKLRGEMCRCMEMAVNERTVPYMREMLKLYDAVEKAEADMGGYALTHKDAECWLKRMRNADGTTGPHWTVEQTAAVAEKMGVRFDHITDWAFNVAMNMMYSDYCGVAMAHGVDTPAFYADLAKAFIFDADGPAPMEKLGAYYCNIVK